MTQEKSEISQSPGQMLDLAKKDPAQAEALWNGLERPQRLRAVLAAGAPDRLRLLTLAKDARALVRDMAVDDFAATVLELGPEDAGLFLARCSDEQLTYLLDLTGWVREKFAPERYAVWLPLLLEGGGERLLRWLRNVDLEVLTLLAAHWFRVVKYLASQDEQEPPDDLPTFTLDGVYFLEFRDEEVASFVAQALVQLKSDMPRRYDELMEAMLWESAAQIAEDAVRWRRGRLMDQGFPDRLEALELWAKPLSGEAEWRKMQPKAELGFPEHAPPRSDASLMLLPRGELLPALAAELDGQAADRLRAELAYVANCGVVALEADPAQPSEVSRAARESLGLANLGLSALSGGDSAQAREILARAGVAALARQGAQALRGLNRRAWILLKEGWLRKLSTTLHVLDYPLDRQMAGLVFRRPRCFDPTLGQGREYRAFHGLGDLEAARRAVAQAEFWGVILFDLMGWEPEQVDGLLRAKVWPEDRREIKISSIMGTWLARRALGLPGLEPLPPACLNRAVELLQKGLAGPLAKEVLASSRALRDPAETALSGELLRGVLGKLKEELGGLDPAAPLEPAFMAGLVVER
ncbi:hypothetical protein AAU61_07945 [Desulfocarbo indianensis]|nr:hypothetical protein AAU61_07945 [Desulfocarbo indianensis]